jgi:hypothetical protein
MTDLNKTGTFAATTNGNFNAIPYHRAKSFRVTNFTGKVIGIRQRHKTTVVDDFNDSDFTEWTGDIKYESSELEGTGAARVNGTSYRVLSNQVILDGSEVEFTIITPSVSPYSLKFSVYDSPTRIGLSGGCSVTISESNSKSYTKYKVTLTMNPSLGTYDAYLEEDGEDRVTLVSGGSALFSANYQFDKLYAFGNSYTDSGNYPDSEWQDRETAWVEYLADSLGVNFYPSSDGGTNYAYGGARLTETYTQSGSPFLTIPSIQSQIQSAPEFLNTDLVAFFGGGNDYLGAGQNAAYISSGIQTNLELLINKGARNIVVLNMINLLTLPGVTDPNAQTVSRDVNTSLSTTVNTLRSQNPTLKIYVVDLYTTADAIASNPSDYGIEGSAFYDDVHMVEEAHKVFSDEAYSLLPKPPIVAVESSKSVVLDPIIFQQKVNFSNEQIGHGGSYVYPCDYNTSEYEIINLGSDAMNYSDNNQSISISGFYAR